MASRAFIDAGYAVSRLEGVEPNDTLLESAIDSACEAIERYTRRRILAGSYSARHSGDDAVCSDAGTERHELYLADPVDRFALTRITAVTSVLEDGAAVSAIIIPGASAPFSTSAGVVIGSETGAARRVSIDAGGHAWAESCWASGIANIEIACTAGWAIDEVPTDLREVARELTWLWYKEGARSGVQQVSEFGATVQLIRTLPLTMQRILSLWRFPLSPQTVVS